MHPLSSRRAATLEGDREPRLYPRPRPGRPLPRSLFGRGVAGLGAVHPALPEAGPRDLLLFRQRPEERRPRRRTAADGFGAATKMTFPGRGAARLRCAAEPGSRNIQMAGSRFSSAAFHAALRPGHEALTAATRARASRAPG